MRIFNCHSLVAISFPALLICCNPADEEEEEGPGQHACEHIDEAGEALTAGATIDAAVPIELSDEPYDVTLVEDGAGTYVGFVELDVDEAMGALLFVDTADLVTGLYLAEAEEPLPESSPNDSCADDIPEHWHLDLTSGDWQIELGPSAIDSLWLMLMSAEGHEHEHD
jgi:hypothetical protein